MPKKDAVALADAAPKKVGAPSGSLFGWPQFLSAAGRFIDKFGASFTIIAILFLSVYFMGSAKTKDDFIREILFAQVNPRPYLQGFLVVLTLDAVFGVSLMRRFASRERQELKRCCEEKAKLQGMLTGKTLARTADHVGNGEQ